MKSKNLLFFLLLISFKFAGAQPAYNYLKEFEIKSGYIEYQLTDAPQSSVKLWWDDHGDRYREEVIRDGRIISILLADGKYFYQINMHTRRGQKVHAETATQVQSHYETLHDTRVLGSETILDYECTITETAGTVTCSFKGIPLRIREGSSIVKQATRFEKNPVSDPVVFLLPSNISITDVTQDLQNELMPKHDEDSRDFPGLDIVYPSACTFEEFLSACKFAAGNLGFQMMMQNAAMGIYENSWINDAGTLLGFQMRALATNLDWEVYEGHNATLFTDSGYKMALRDEHFYDEETGTSGKTSLLVVSLPHRDALLYISLTPQKSKQEMLAIFYALDL